MHRLPLLTAPALLVLLLAVSACAPLDGAETPAGDATAASASSEAAPSEAASVDATAAMTPTAQAEAGSPTVGATAPGTGGPGTPQSAPAERITFPPGGTSASVPGQLAANGMAKYVLNVQGGQFMIATLSAEEGSPTLSVHGADGTVLISPMAGAHGWSGEIPSTQDYFIDVAAGASPANYSLSVTVPPASQPTSAVPPPAEAERISFAPGGTSATRNGTLAANSSVKYVLALNEGKTFIVSTTGSPYPVAVSVAGADGEVMISPMGSVPSWEGKIPSTQDYFVDVIAGDGPTNYTVTFTAPAQ
jgi:hypothetical protein